MSTLSFLQSPWFWSLGALLPLVVIFYLLKLKRRPMVIPSTLLWRRAVEDLVANAPFQKLRNNILLWLQLLLLAFLIFAFMRPVLKLDDIGGSTTVFLVDQSASMKTIEADGLSRLDKAKQAAFEALATMKDGDQGIVIAFADRTSVVQTMTTDRGALRNALESIQPRDVATRLRETGTILQGLTTYRDADGTLLPLDRVRTILFSDGSVRDAEALVDIPNLDFVLVGETDDNLGISAVDVRESYTDGFEYQIFASVTNASEEERTAVVEFQVEGELIDLRAVAVPPLGTTGIVFRTAEQLDGIATLRLEGGGALAADDLARLRLSPPGDIRVLLVTTSNYFLERVLQVDPRVSVSLIRPTDYTPRADFDIVVFDNCTTGELPDGRFVFINSMPPIRGFEAAGEPRQNPRVMDWNRVHPLNRFVNFDELLIGQALRYTTPDSQSTISILETGDGDLITFHESETQRVLVIGFDIFKSYWPLDVSFPIFIANMLDLFGRDRAGLYQPAYATGQPILLTPERDAARATVTTPAGALHEFSFEGVTTAYMTETHEAGVYAVEFDNGSRHFVPVNLLSEAESMIAPLEAIDVGGRVVQGSFEVVRVNREIWPWIAALALALLMLEWVVYCRRSFM